MSSRLEDIRERHRLATTPDERGGGGQEALNALYAHAPYDIAWCIAEIDRLRAWWVEKAEMDFIAVAQRELDRMRASGSEHDS